MRTVPRRAHQEPALIIFGIGRLICFLLVALVLVFSFVLSVVMTAVSALLFALCQLARVLNPEQKQ